MSAKLANPLTSRTILVVNDSPESANLGTSDDGAAAGVQHGMVEAAGARKHGLLFVALDAIDAAMQRRLLEDVPAGVALLCWRPRSVRAAKLAESFSRRNVPVAAFGMDECPEAVACYDRVVSDHESGMAQLLEHLARAGRRRILRLWTPSPDTPWIAAHERAFASLAGPLGLEAFPPVHVASLPDRLADDRGVFEQRARVMAGYIAENIRGGRTPDAIMVGTDCETFPVAAACRMLGLAPGEDVLITGYDNYWHAAFERRFEPSLPFASVDKRNAEIGAEMIRLLSGRIADGNQASPRLSRIEQVAVEVNYRQNGARGVRA